MNCTGLGFFLNSVGVGEIPGSYGDKYEDDCLVG
jgi:hypothetical protein